MAAQRLPGAVEVVELRSLSRENQARLDAVAALERATFGKKDAWDKGIILQEATKKTARVFLCLAAPPPHQAGAARALAGYLFCTVTTLGIHVTRVAVAPRFRRQGIARALLQLYEIFGSPAALAAAKKPHASLFVDPQNAPALGLYKSIGFCTVHEVLDYYGPGRPAWRMQRDVGGP